MPKVSIIIPTFNGQKLLERNLPAVLKCSDKADEIIVIDDASTDATIDWLLKKFQITKPCLAGSPRAEAGRQAKFQINSKFKILKTKITVKAKSLGFVLIINHANSRFAESVNRGVKVAQGDHVFLLNNDVSPKADCLDKLKLQVKSQKLKVFAVSCLEIEKINGKKVLGGKNKLWFERGLFQHSRADNFESGETAWASGGSALFNRHKWLALKGFDLSYYPAYWEDLDLSFRAKQRGWLVLFNSQAQVDHNHESTNKSAFGQKKIELMSMKNIILFTWKNGSLLQKLQHLLWLPYHLIFTNLRTKGLFGLAYVNFLMSLIRPRL